MVALARNKTDAERAYEARFDFPGHRIALLRQQEGLTQEQLATHIDDKLRRDFPNRKRGCSRPTLAQWETNSTSPDVQACKVIGALFNVSPAYIAFGTETEMPIEKPSPLVNVLQVSYTDPDKYDVVDRWGVPRKMIKAVKSTVLVKMTSDDLDPTYALGDTVFLDTAKKDVYKGVYAYWNGESMAFAYMKPAETGEGIVNVTIGGKPMPVQIDAIEIMGRVVGKFALDD